jgi:hypothetical protein
LPSAAPSVSRASGRRGSAGGCGPGWASWERADVAWEPKRAWPLPSIRQRLKPPPSPRRAPTVGPSSATVPRMELIAQSGSGRPPAQHWPDHAGGSFGRPPTLSRFLLEFARNPDGAQEAVLRSSSSRPPGRGIVANWSNTLADTFTVLAHHMAAVEVCPWRFCLGLRRWPPEGASQNRSRTHDLHRGLESMGAAPARITPVVAALPVACASARYRDTSRRRCDGGTSC